MGDPDLVLLDRWVDGDAAAGRMLFHQYFKPLYRFFEHKTDNTSVDDLVQETLLACLKSREKFKRQSTFRTYVFAVARHILFGYWRRRSSHAAVPIDDVSIASLSTSLGTRVAREQAQAQLLEALQSMPMDQQNLLELFYWYDFDREQLAEVFEVEPATIGSRLFRARQALAVKLGHRVGDEAFDGWARSLTPTAQRVDPSDP